MEKLFIDDCEVKEAPLAWQKLGLMQTATGYGSKLTTTKMLRHNNRWHRIYCMCWSNIGTCYILSRGQQIIVS
jgi:hypothetical protein